MRDIKFRVWCKENKQFIQFNKMGFLEDGSLWYVQEVDENEPPYFENQNNWELMQYTGLKDKNGVEINEGDIVKNIRNGISRKVYWDAHCASFHLSKQGKKESNVDYWSLSNPQWNYEVIGNVYQNKGLLEG